jgi:D-alanine-D-alanine ligase
MEELTARVHYIWKHFSQPALVEEFLCGEEYTVAMIGNEEDLKILPIKNIIEESAYEKYAIITQCLKIDNKLSFEIPMDEMEELRKLAIQTKEAVGFWDHVRIDMRRDKDGILRVIEVNGIPGLNPVKSRIFEIYNLFYPENKKEDNYCNLLEDVVQAALARNKRMENEEIEIGKKFAL